MNQNKAMAAAGALWCFIGGTLLVRGLSFIQLLLDNPVKGPLLRFFEKFSVAQSFSAPLVILLVGVLIGFVKGNTVLKKVAQKNIARLSTLDQVPVWKVFPPAGWMIMILMSCMGIAIKTLGVSSDIRSLILVAVGSALIQGGMTYFTAIVKQMLIKS